MKLTSTIVSGATTIDISTLCLKLNKNDLHYSAEKNIKDTEKISSTASSDNLVGPNGALADYPQEITARWRLKRNLPAGNVFAKKRRSNNTALPGSGMAFLELQLD
jgi:hypothetical protein